MAYKSSNKEGHQDRYYSFSSKIYFVGYSLEGAYNLFLWRNKEERKTTYGERERESERKRENNTECIAIKLTLSYN